MPTDKHSLTPRHHIPTNLVQPLWFRSRESLVDNGLVYDPIAAKACQSCHLAPECLSGDIDQKIRFGGDFRRLWRLGKHIGTEDRQKQYRHTQQIHNFT